MTCAAATIPVPSACPEPSACIVTRSGSPMELMADVADLPAGGVLMHGRRATVFPDATAARAAVARSWRYARRRGYDWGQDEAGQWRIWRLRPAAGEPTGGEARSA